MANRSPHENGAASVPAGAAPAEGAALRDGSRNVTIPDRHASEISRLGTRPPHSNLLSVDEAVRALPVRKSRRWLVEFLHKTASDPHGQPLYRLAGRDKLIYFDRLIEALPCPSRSSKPAAQRRRTSISAGRTSASQWTRAAELTGDQSLLECCGTSSAQSSKENTHRGKPRLIVDNRRS